jgi:putative spermidine/putrescine transport system permease protein
MVWRTVRNTYLALIYTFLLAPVLVAVLTSFNPTRLNVFPPKGFSLIWYREFLQADNFTHAFAAVSLKIALIVAPLTGLLALPTAYAVTRYRFTGRALLQTIFLSPMMVPQMVVGIALLLFFARYTFADELRIITGHVIITMPIAIRAITASLEGLDPMLEEAAKSLGASPLQTFSRVTAPLIGSGLLAAMLFAFTLSFTDVNVALFLTGPRTNTLPVEVFAYLRWESTPVIAAIASIQVAMILAIALVINRLTGLETILKY